MTSVLIPLTILATMLLMITGGYWMSWQQTKNQSWWLAVIFLLLLGFHFSLLLMQFTVGQTFINLVRGVIAAVLPAIGYLAFAISAREKQVLKYGDWIHLVPLALFMFVLTTRFANHWLILTDVFYGVLLLRLRWYNEPVARTFVIAARFMGVLFLIFASLDAWILWDFSKQVSLIQSKGLVVTLTLSVCFGLGVLLFSVFKNQRLIDVFSNLGTQLSNRLNPNRLDESVLVEIAGKVQDYVVNSRCFMDEGCDLKSVSRAIARPARHVSAAINHHFGYGFSTFINDHKVEEAKRLLRSSEGQNKSITDVMFESGYQTKSSFNREFLRRVQMSPSKYRRQASSS